MNFLTENNILQYEDLLKKIDEIILDSEQAADSLKQVEKKLSDMAVLIDAPCLLWYTVAN